MKRVLAFILLALLLTAAVSCGGAADNGAHTRLTFAESIDMDRIKELGGTTVEIVGYMATVSPVSGKYMYLMNLPYQSCPYCVPNTQQLSNTIAVYAKSGDKFEFTDGPINVVGTLETGNFKDEYGYTYNYRIKDAVYTAVNSTEASEKLALWERVSNAGIASEVYSMFDFIDFEINWPNYTAKFEEGEDYLYPADVEHFETTQYAKQNAEGYFDDLAKRAKAIGDDVMNDLVAIIKDGKAIAARGKSERADKNYTYDNKAGRYVLTNGEQMKADAQALYVRFANWLENFSLSK